MAMTVQPLLIGVDVSKRTLDICSGEQTVPQSIPNERQAIVTWLKSLPSGPIAIAIEATNTFHLLLCTLAHKAGHSLYLIDGYRLSRYRDSIGVRAKNDAADARLLRRFLANERDSLRSWTPPPRAYTALQGLLSRRAALVQARVALQQSLSDVPELKRASQKLFAQLKQLDLAIGKLIMQALEQAGWSKSATRIRAIDGIGPLTSAALVMAYHRGNFRSSDAFIAFLGLDVRVRDSGQMRGRRKLTKKGNPELRRLLYLAAMRACRSPVWRPFYQRHLDRGLAPIQALVVLARKLARIAFAILRSGTEYEPKIPISA